MHSNNPFSRILFVIIAVLVMRGIFVLIVWRGSVLFGFSVKSRMILLLSLGLLATTAIAMTMSSLPWKSAAVVGAILIWLIYVIWVISPLLIVSDIISIRYKIPPVIIASLSVIWLGLGIYYGTTIKTTAITLSSDKLTQDYKIVFISDLHVDAIHSTGYLQKIVNRIQKIKPDFVIIGGDLMNMAKAEYADAFLPFDQLEIPVYATLGNHDNMGNNNAALQIFEKTKIMALRNQSIDVQGIQLVGIDDKSYRGDKKLTEILDESNIQNNGKYTILVSHQPQNLAKLNGYPINLELAGHTHNGQFFPMTLIIKLFNDYSYGEKYDNGMTAFVSQGIGSWGAPIRIGTQSELVLISLKKSGK